METIGIVRINYGKREKCEDVRGRSRVDPWMKERMGSLWAGAELIDDDSSRREAIGCEKR